MSRSDLMVAIWRPLKKMVEAQDVNRKALARQLGLGASGLSELLNGLRATAPSRDVVRTIVSACGEDAQLSYWDKRLTELKDEAAETGCRSRSA
ncbi:helix-turn-helix domain-containing protein [Streptomyces curacoi]|uniref:HTH cro/C1-type domain-containing protein n=1 Tax=Streptomyces curacoi TaxID=146536 RepID=A0A124GXV5_9ACTN|nr:helix-turn-helix transcriptional regulator [Streptomyces curacoi]KUM71296.1 hypothetical protein AQI70_27445 [Streptomyces curacoi]